MRNYWLALAKKEERRCLENYFLEPYVNLYVNHHALMAEPPLVADDPSPVNAEEDDTDLWSSPSYGSFI